MREKERKIEEMREKDRERTERREEKGEQIIERGLRKEETERSQKTVKRKDNYCLLNLSSALVLFANPAIYVSSSPINCKDSFLIALTIATAHPKLFTIKLDQSSFLKELCLRTAQANEITSTDSNVLCYS